MSTTNQVRIWYPEIVTNHADRGTAGFQPECDLTEATRHIFPRGGGALWHLWVHPKTVEAWDAYVVLMDAHGVVVPSAGGTHNCRNIAGTAWPSLHAYGVAVDIPPNDSKPQAFQDAVLAIRTNSGARVFKNLDSINDRMHDQIDCSPADLATGIDWATVGDDMPLSDQDLEKIGALIDERLELTDEGVSLLAVRSVWNVPHGGRLMKDNLVDARKAAEAVDDRLAD